MGMSEITAYKLKLLINYNGKWKAFWFKDLVWLRAEGNYTQLCVHHVQTMYNISVPIGKIEKMLPMAFFRPHRSCIVNIAHIDSFEKKQIITVTGHQFPVARNKLNDLKKLLLEMPRITIPNCKQCENCEEWETCEDIRPFFYRSS